VQDKTMASKQLIIFFCVFACLLLTLSIKADEETKEDAPAADAEPEKLDEVAGAAAELAPAELVVEKDKKAPEEAEEAA